MKVCSNCGNQVPDDAVFCNNCGSSLADAASVPTPAADAGQAAPTPAPAPVPVPTPAPAPNGQPNGFQQAPYGQQNYQQPNFQPQPGYQPYQKFDPNDRTAEFDAKDIADNKLFAASAYFFSFFAGVLAGIYVKDSEFIKFHTKVSLQYDLAFMLLCLICCIPFVGWIVGIIGILVIAVCKIISIVYVFQGKAKNAPIVGSIGFLKF